MNLNGRTINPGELRTKVLLAPRTVSTETGGFPKAVPTTASQVSAWARWTNVHGAEAWTANAQGIEQAATVLIRYRSTLDESWMVSRDNGTSWYEIVSMDNIQQRGEYIELKVKRMRVG